MPLKFRYVCWSAALCAALACHTASIEGAEPVVSASGNANGLTAAGAVDGDRFSCEAGSLWKADAASAWWQIEFPEPRQIGAILQINGDHGELLENVPSRYVWRASNDGESWHDVDETRVECERRLFRVHRLAQPIEARYLRLEIRAARGDVGALREVEFFEDTNADAQFPPWIVAVNSAEDRTRNDTATPFVRLARSCDGWKTTPAQVIWHGDFDEEFLAVEPTPLCAFFSGSYLEWCQRSREPWRGVERVLKSRRLPMWASCGGAQALVILDETGADAPWDCPRCRDAARPLLAVYSHIGHTGHAECGDYTKNVAERGAYAMRRVAEDPAFAGLPEVFEVMESHVGQIAYVPDGWTRLVTAGPGALTENQCLRVVGRPIYAAQFHIEMDGTEANSQRIMANFLTEAARFGGYRANSHPAPR